MSNLIDPIDQLFREEYSEGSFRFDHSVAHVFDNMAERSIPLYRNVIGLTAFWTRTCFIPDTYIYDLGMSTGNTFSAIVATLPSQISAHFIGIDLSAEMLERAKQKLTPFLKLSHTFDLQQASLIDFEFKASASVVIANYTLQFLPVEVRRSLIERVYRSLVPGGIFILSEKIKFADKFLDTQVTRWYEDWKYAQGYSREEIASKKRALSGVLIPETEEFYRQLLQESGFGSWEVIAKQQNFVTFLARKSLLSTN